MEIQKKFSLCWKDSVLCCHRNSKPNPPSRTSDYPRNKHSLSEPDATVRPSSSEPDATVRPSSSEPDPTVRPSSSEPDPTVRPSSSELDATVRPSSSEPDTTVRPSSSEPDTTVRPSSSELDATVRPSSSEPDPTVMPSPPAHVRTDEGSYIALYDFSAQTEKELSFNAGDTLEVLDKGSGQWWTARALTGVSASRQGHIPADYVTPVQSLEVEPWYFPNTHRQDAEKMLLAEGNQTGAFLIRSSENINGTLVLSVLDKERVKHYKVLKLENGHYYVSETKFFPTLKELVEYYSNQSNILGVRLCEPCKKVPPTIKPPAIPDLEIDRSSIKLQRKLGAGQFGDVYEGLWNGFVSVAVKILKPDKMHPVDFLQEAQFMKKLRHPKLIQLYAICTLKEPVFIITELMKNGSLLEYLQKDQGATLCVSDLIEMAAQVASGMEFLESQNYIHRDLAARNVLVGENNICKVADFGLARILKREDEDVYEAREGSKFPVKWTAPESITKNKFTVKSDVWSFGVLLYEIMTFGQMPYPGMSNLQAVQWIIKGNRMQCPPNCPPAMHNIMMDCWNKEEQDRPTFELLQWKLEDLFDLPQ